MMWRPQQSILGTASLIELMAPGGRQLAFAIRLYKRKMRSGKTCGRSPDVERDEFPDNSMEKSTLLAQLMVSC